MKLYNIILFELTSSASLVKFNFVLCVFSNIFKQSHFLRKYISLFTLQFFLSNALILPWISSFHCYPPLLILHNRFCFSIPGFYMLVVKHFLTLFPTNKTLSEQYEAYWFDFILPTGVGLLLPLLCRAILKTE